MYFEHVLRYSAVFPKDQLKLIISEEMYGDMGKTLEDIAEWVGIQRDGFGEVKNYNSKASDIQKMAVRIAKDNKQKEVPTPITDFTKYRDTEAELILQQFYKPYNDKLAQLLGRPLPW